MADPGSLIGAVSLGLQVLQGLKVYYSQFKGYHDDINAVIERTERVDSILRVLERPVRRLERDDDLSADVRTCITKCAEAVQKLDKYRRRCGEPDHAADTLKKRLVLVKMRAAYPFRKDTLGELQSLLDRILENLQVVLQVLQIDTSIRFHEQAECRSSSTQQDVAHIRHRQVYTNELLEAIDHKIERQTIGTSQHVSRVQLQLINVEDKLDSLAASVGLLQRPGYAKSPSILRESCDQYMDTFRSVNAMKHGQNCLDNCLLACTEYHLPTFKCTCPKTSRRHKKPFRNRWMTTFRLDESQHLASCPLFISSQRAVTVGVRLRAYRSTLGYLIDASLSWSSRDLSPHVSCRNVVPHYNPAFALIRVLIRLVLDRNDCQISEAVMITLKSLFQLLKNNRAHISDVTLEGETVPHEIFKVIAFVYGPYGATKGPTKMIGMVAVKSMKEFGYALDERSDTGLTPFDTFLGYFLFGKDISLDGVDMTSFNSLSYSYSALCDGFTLSTNHHVAKESYLALGSHNASGYECRDGPLTQSLLRRSETELLDCLNGKGVGYDEDEREFSFHTAANWPQGLRMLLSHGFSPNTSDRHGYTALDYAISYQNLESVQILGREGGLPRVQTWTRALQSRNSDIIQCVAHAFAQSLHQDMEKAHSTLAEQATLEFVNSGGLYLTWNITLNAAQILFDAGIREFGETVGLWQHAARNWCLDQIKLLAWFVSHGARFDSKHPTIRTMPLNIVAEKVAIYSVSNFKGVLVEDNACYMRWLLQDFGASDRVTNRSLLSQVQTSAEPNVDSYMADGVHSHNDIPKRHEIELLLNTLGETNPDDCNCWCALGGCTGITSALKAVGQATFRYSSIGDVSCAYLQRRVLRIILNLLPRKTISDPWIYRSATRTMTFDALKLTHTCHNHFENEYVPVNGRWAPRKPLPEQDINAIHYSESTDLALLEALLEEFELEWLEYDGTLLQFIDGYWTQRMEEVTAERNATRGDEMERLEEIGVRVEEFGPKAPAKTEELPERGTWKWFQWAVDRIMDGTYMDDSYSRRILWRLP